MVNNYPEMISAHISKDLNKELKKEAKLQNKPLGEYIREIVMNRNEHKDIDVSNDNPIYKVTLAHYRSDVDVEELLRQYNNDIENLFDGTYGWIKGEIVSIEEVKG